MKGVELYGRVRHAVRIEGLSHREAARRFGIDPRTVAKMIVFSVPPGPRALVPPGFFGFLRAAVVQKCSRSRIQRGATLLRQLRSKACRFSHPLSGQRPKPS
jgi:hypothetical protein